MDGTGWGKGSGGQLGYGDSDNRGDSSGEMADNLPFVDVAFTHTDSVTSSCLPYFLCDAEPTTAAPTSEPTMVPSVSPTDPQCDVDEMYDVNWHNLVRSHSLHFPSLCIFCQSPCVFSPRIILLFDTVSTLLPLVLHS